MTALLDNLSSSQQLVARLVIAELLRNGIDCFCVSPGARCIPLIEALETFPSVQVRLFNDERAAAFWSLGYAKAVGRPAVLICTSGTAAANYFPAIVEASTAGVPMFVITADRPWELQYANANQTIKQSGLYGSYSKLSIDVSAADQMVYPRSLLANVDQLAATCRLGFPGVVHLNIAFRKPFSTSEVFIPKQSEKDFVESWETGLAPLTTFLDQSLAVSSAAMESVAKLCQSAKNILISVGNQTICADRQALVLFASKLGSPIFADLHSNLRGLDFAENIFSLYNLYFEQLTKDCFPDLVLHFGGRPISERLREFIQNTSAKVVVISNLTSRQDVLENDFFDVVLKICSAEEEFARVLTEKLAGRAPSKLLSHCLLLESQSEQKLDSQFRDQSCLTEAGLIRNLTKTLCVNCDLYVSPSLLCRELEHFASLAPNVRCLGNRGVSGIDGLLASSSGFACAAERRLFILIGDQACWHDFTSLDLLRRFNKDLHVIIFNNNGGAVFNLLEAATIKPKLINSHNHHFAAVEELFGLNYALVKDWQAWEQRSREITDSQSITCTEVIFDATEAASFFKTFKV